MRSWAVARWDLPQGEVEELLTERGIEVDRATIDHRVGRRSTGLLLAAARPYRADRRRHGSRRRRFASWATGLAE
jgi:transposase-like protein